MNPDRRTLLTRVPAAALLAVPSLAAAVPGRADAAAAEPERRGPVPAVTRALARHVADARIAAVPEDARIAARRSLLDMVGVMLAATGLEPQAALYGAQAAEDGGKAEATLLGRGTRVPAAAAAFANGALAHAIDYGDGHPETLVHPHGALVPAALAVAERTRATGAALLTAIAVGADVAVRCARGLGTDPDGGAFYRPALVGAFGAAAAAGSLMKFDADRIAASWALLIAEIGTGAAIKRGALRGLRDAYAARSGVSAALLAARGVGGDIVDPIEGEGGFLAMFGRPPSPEAMLTGLGQRFDGAGVEYKRWPACGGTHPHIEAVLLMREEGLKPADVASIEARVSPVFYKMVGQPEAAKRAPQDAVTAKFSMFWCLGIALAKGAVTLSDFDAPALRDPVVAAVAARVRCVADAGLDPLAGTVVVTMKDGSRRERTISNVGGGSAKLLMDDAALTAKFEDCVAHAARPLPAARARAIAAWILALDSQTDGTAFVRALDRA